MGEKEKLICDKEFKEELLLNFNELREENVLCDVTLRTEEQDFVAHRCVLNAASQYFRTLFTSGIDTERKRKQRCRVTRGKIDCTERNP